MQDDKVSNKAPEVLQAAIHDEKSTGKEEARSSAVVSGIQDVDSKEIFEKNESSQLNQRTKVEGIPETLKDIEQDALPTKEACSVQEGETSALVPELAPNTPKTEDRPSQEVLTIRAVTQKLAEVPVKFSSPLQTKKRPEDSIEAIDALEDALEQIGNEIPLLNGSDHPKNGSSSDGNSKRTAKRSLGTIARKGASRADNSSLKSARIKTIKPGHIKAASVQETGIDSRYSIRAKTHTSKSANSDAQKASNKQTESPKRRPVSLSFPTPQPPPKSRKPPTKPTFQLPGEAVAAKLKAQREERLKREETNEPKKRESQLHPVRKSVAPAIPVKGTVTSRARMSAAHQQPNNAPSGGTKRVSVVQKPFTPRKPAQIAKPNTTLTKTGPRRPPTKTPLSSTPSNTARPRTTSSSITSNSSATVKSAATRKSSVTASDIVQQRQKAREIFARDRQENDEREAARWLKEDAARKARAEASERGRIASREWAERQKTRHMAGSVAAKRSAAGSEMESASGKDVKVG